MLATPVTLEITKELLARFNAAGISTSWDIEQFDQMQGWLAELKAYTFNRSITIEGPCAFYGGPYAPNAWSAEGGLCSMGAASYSHSPLPEGVSVGRYCSIGKGLRFLDFSHPTGWLSSSVVFFKPVGVNSVSALAHLSDRLIEDKTSGTARKEFDPKLGRDYPQIGHDVWIGENVSLAMGIHVGTGAIVTRDVPPYAVVSGVPALVRRYRFDEDIVRDLLALEWWKYCFADFEGLDVTQPRIFINGMMKKIAERTIQEWQPAVLTLPY